MKCSKCGVEVDHLIANQVAALPGTFPKTIKTVAYCCPNGCILGVESDPDIRDETIRTIQRELSGLLKKQEEQEKRNAFRAMKDSAK
jgi:hypothetical protein